MFTLTEIATHRSYRVVNSQRGKSNKEEIVIPSEIENLIDDKRFRPKYRKMIKDGFLKDLLLLAEVAQEIGRDPSKFFAVKCKNTYWDNTRKWLKEVRRVRKNAEDIARRLNVSKENMKAVYKACWKVKNALKQAVTAQEIGRDPFKLFNWLIWVGDNPNARVNRV
jgi:membrane-associated HD superfamily phosphohydrolase